MNYPITVMYLIDTYVSAPGTLLNGGAEKQLYLLASGLNPEEFRPVVVQLSPDRSYPVETGGSGPLELIHFPTGRIYGLDGLRQIGRLISFSKNMKVDIIHTFFEKSEVMGWILARLSRIPIWITSRRDLGFKRKKIYDTLFRFTAKDCKRCVANCQAVREQVIQRRNLPTQRVEVIYNGLDFSLYQKPSEHGPLRENLGVENGSPLIGMVANFNFKIKGHQYFLEAAKKVLEKMPNTEFLLVGDGPLRPQYEQMASELGVLRKVHFLGRRSDVPMIITNLDVSVLPSTSEGLSNVILESMAAGKPVIATNVGGSREIVQDGVTGYLVTPADSQALADRMLTLLRNRGRAKTFGLEGRKVVEEKFTVEAMVKKYEKLYMSLVEEHYR